MTQEETAVQCSHTLVYRAGRGDKKPQHFICSDLTHLVFT